MPDTLDISSSRRTPPGLLLHGSSLLTGFATAFLGPLLPGLLARLHASDSGGGAMLAAQFAGAFLGGWLTREPLRACLQRGFACAATGFALLALAAAQGWPLAAYLPCLLLLGFGAGQMIPSTNLLAAERWATRRGAALTLLNFTWSAGALSGPLVLPALANRWGVSAVWSGAALLFLLGFVGSFALPWAGAKVASDAGPGTGEPLRDAQTPQPGLPRATYLYFCALLAVYGGVETSLSGWLHTYDGRYGAAVRAIALSTTVFWVSLTTARAAATALLLRLPETWLLRAGSSGAVAAMCALLFAHGTLAISICAGVLGATLAPWFPLVLSRLTGEGPNPTQVGRIIAVSGLGAAALPWLVGQLSAWSGSLRASMLLPLLGMLALLALSFRGSGRQDSVPRFPVGPGV